MNNINRQKKANKTKSVSKKTILALICSFLVCLFFLASFLMTVPVEKDSCELITTSFEYCKTIKGKYVSEKGLHIYCTNSKSYYIDEAYLGYGLKENIEALDKGAKLTLLADNNDGEIIELIADDEVLLSYSDYVVRVEKEKKSNLLFFILTLSLPIIAVINIHRQKKQIRESKALIQPIQQKQVTTA